MANDGWVLQTTPSGEHKIFGLNRSRGCELLPSTFSVEQAKIVFVLLQKAYEDGQNDKLQEVRYVLGFSDKP